ncbi:MAG: flagellar basal body rod protein FlgB [Acidobacteriota bacterium]
MSWLDNQSVQGLVNYLDVTALREKLAVGNIANIDTPGYRTLDINFQDALRQADQGAGTSSLPPPVFQVKGLIERPDGNNVSLDRESIILAGVQLEYRTAAALLHEEFKRIQMAINGNGGA